MGLGSRGSSFPHGEMSQQLASSRGHRLDSAAKKIKVFQKRPLSVCVRALLMTVIGFGSSTVIAEQVSAENTLAQAPAETGNIESLEKIVVTGTKTPNPAFDLPMMIEQIDLTQAEHQGVNNLSDLFFLSPSVDVTGTPRRNGQVLKMRGFDQNGVLVLLDGVRQGTESAHDGDVFIDPQLLKRVEIVKGANSAIFGAGAMGGVILMETKSAADLAHEYGRSSGWLVSALTQTSDDEKRGTVSYFHQGNHVDWLGVVSRTTSDDIELSDGSDLLADDEVTSALLKGNIRLTDQQDLELMAIWYENDSYEPGNPQTAGGGFGATFDDKVITAYTVALTHHYQGESPWLNTSTQIFRNFSDIDELVKDSVFSIQPEGTDISRALERYGINFHNISDLPFSTGNHRLLTGVDYVHEEQDGDFTRPDGVDFGAAPGIPDAESESYGLYAQYEWNFDRLYLMGGVRWDHFESEAETVSRDVEASEWSPRIAASYAVTETWRIFANYSYSFRAPTLSETFIAGPHFPGNSYVPNPDLEPERGRMLEVGVGYESADIWFAGDILSTKLSRYQSEVDDYIDGQVIFARGITRFRNVSDAEIWGVDWQAEYLYQQWQLSMKYNYVRARDKETGEYLKNNSPHTLTTVVSYDLPTIQSEIGYKGRFADALDKVPARGLEAVSGYGVHGVFFEWQGQGQLANLKAGVNIDNITDTHYQKAQTATAARGRNIRLTASYAF